MHVEEKLTSEWSPLLDFHMKSVWDRVNENSELRKAIHFLNLVINVVKVGGCFTMALFHLRRVQDLVKGDEELNEDGELELHLEFLTDCVHALGKLIHASDISGSSGSSGSP